MERLTIRNSDGSVSQPTSTTIQAVFEKLAAYEDTGLEPANIEELLQKTQQLPKWVSVEERLPEDQGDDARMARGRDYIHKVIAVSVTPNYTAMDTAYLYNGRWALGQYTSWEHFMGAPVTHWMPLPAPPKEVRDA